MIIIVSLIVSICAPYIDAINLNFYTNETMYLSTIFNDVKDYLVTDDPALLMLEKAITTNNYSIGYKALLYDSDEDGIPDIFEAIDGLNPFMTNSMGYNDKEYYVGRIIIDGYDIDWKINSRSITQLNIISSSFSAPYNITAIYATQDQINVYVLIEFERNIIYINNSSWKLFLEINGKVIFPEKTNKWGLCIEASFNKRKIIEEGFTGTLILIHLTPLRIQKLDARLNITSINWLNPRSWSGFIEPLYLRLRTIPSNLPWYPVIAMGDTQQDWFETTYTIHTYRSLWQARTISPDALVIAGDETGSGMRKQIMEFLRASAGIANIWVVAGNHDWSYTKYNDRPYWYRMMVNDLYVRNMGNWSFVLLNGFALDKSLAERLDETLNQLSIQNKYIVLVWHVPIITGSYNYPTDFSKWQMDTLRSLVAKYRTHIKLMIFGHWHLWRTGVYDGIRYIITGGAGAPWLSSPKLGLPVYHYTVLLFYNNGTFTYEPVSTDNGVVMVNWTRNGDTIIYNILNTKTNVYGKPVPIPIHITRYIRGVCFETYLIARPGLTKLTIKISGDKAYITTTSNNWYVYSWLDGLHMPRDGIVLVSIGAKENIGITGIMAKDKNIVADINPSAMNEAWVKLRVNNTEYTALMTRSENKYVYDVMSIIGMNSKAYINDTVTVYVTNGYETVNKTESGLDFMPPILRIMYFTEYVKQWENITVVELDASQVKLVITLDGKMIIYDSSLGPGRNSVQLNISLIKLSEGKHYLLIKAWDIHNNTYTLKLYLIIDRTPPRILVQNPYPIRSPEQFIYIHSYDSSTYTVTVVCQSTGMSQYYSGLQGDAEIKLQPIQLGIMGNGTYKVTITATDMAGNTANKTIELIIGEQTQTTTTTFTTTSSVTSTTSTSQTKTSQSSTPTSTYTPVSNTTTTQVNKEIIPFLIILAAAITIFIIGYIFLTKRR